jgi:hypothetical protein
MRRFPAPWTVEQIPGGYKVLDANGQSLAYVYGRETKADADTAHVLNMDETRRIASNIAKLPKLLGEMRIAVLQNRNEGAVVGEECQITIANEGRASRRSASCRATRTRPDASL